MPAPKTWIQDDMRGGLDLRGGVLAQRLEGWETYDNWRTDSAGKPVRRPPLAQMDLTIDTDCQGMIWHDGKLYTFADADDSVSHTGTDAADLGTLSFDAPPGQTDWTLLHAMVYNGVPVALIKHATSNTYYPAIVCLHVWDGSEVFPTYVTDPYFPGSFAPSAMRNWQYDEDFEPRMGIAAGKLWVTVADGRVACCQTGNPRNWNRMTAEELLIEGESVIFALPTTGANVRTVYVPILFPDLRDDPENGYAWWNLERYIGDGKWESLQATYVTAAPADLLEWRCTQVSNPWSGGGSGAALQIDIYDTATHCDDIFRFRACPGTCLTAEHDALPAVTKNGVGVDVAAHETVHPLRIFTSSLGPPPTAWAESGGLKHFDGATDNGWAANEDHLIAIHGHNAFGFATAWPGSSNETTNGMPAGPARSEQRIFKRCTVNSGASDITIKDFLYGFESETDLYLSLQAKYVEMAGANDAMLLDTAAHERMGETVTAIAGTLTRLLVAYGSSLQLWAVDPDPNLTRFLDGYRWGTGDQDHASPVGWQSGVILPTVQAWRAVSLEGYNTDSMAENNIGEKIEALEMLEVLGATYWPWFGQFVVGGQIDQVLEFRVLDYSKDSKVLAWSRWPSPAGLSWFSPETLIAAGSKLYFRSGSSIYYFDALATTLRDVNDDAGDAYTSKAISHYNDLKAPGRLKRYVALHLAVEGQVAVGYQLIPHDGPDEAHAGPDLNGPTIAGVTYGHPRIGIMTTAPGMRLEISTQSESAVRILRYGYEYLVMGR